LVEVEHPRLGKVTVAGPAARLSETPAAVRTASPLMGQHTDEVMKELLGLSEAQIGELRAAGAFGPA
jgi:crotonobetainyl-CoA:carnitine CoA-transferase CaiB-like acyl-CoA transferase